MYFTKLGKKFNYTFNHLEIYELIKLILAQSFEFVENDSNKLKNFNY